MRKKRNLVIVADRGRARFFSQEVYKLKELADMSSDHRLPQEVESDKQGRFQSKGTAIPQHFSYSPHTELSTKQRENFANDIVVQTRKIRDAQDFDGIILIASPKFLGVLRSVLNDQERDQIKKEIAKELTKLPLTEIALYLKNISEK